MTSKLSIRVSFIFLVMLVFAGLFWVTDLALQHISFGGLTAVDPAEIRRAIRLKEIAPGYSGKVFPEYLHSTDGLVRQPYKLETDEDGFIKPSKVHEKPDLKIFFVGGSTTECLFVSESNRWPFLVGRILEAKTLRKLNSYNAGVSGNNSLHSINIILNKILPLEPNVIVLMENANDLTVLAYEQTYWNNNRYRSPIIDLETLTTFFERGKRFLRRTLPGWFLALRTIAHKLAPPDEFAPLRNSRITVNADKLKLSFRRNLIAFIGLARAYDVEPILMTQFNRIENNDVAIRRLLERTALISVEEYVNLYKEFNEEIRKVAREKNVKLIDLAKEIPGTNEFIYDPYHVNDAGSKMVAEVIARRLLAFGI